MNEFYFTPPSKAFQFKDRPEVLGWGSMETREAFCYCNSAAQARFVKDAINAEIDRRAAENGEGGR